LMEDAEGMDSLRRSMVAELLASGRLTIDETLPQRPAVAT